MALSPPHPPKEGIISPGFVLVGSVDHSKSSIAGQILRLSGSVDEREYEKYKSASYKLLDVLEEEQERGITVEVSRIDISIQGNPFTLLDCPGHRAYVNSVLSEGLSGASIAILVISARKGEFEAGMKDRIPEILLFLKGYNISTLIVAIGKMDTIEWSEESYITITDKVAKIVSGYRLQVLHFVPVSGLNGDNIRDPIMKNWKKPPITLFDALLDARKNLITCSPPTIKVLTTIPRLLLRVTGSVLITKGFSCILHLGPITCDCEVIEMIDKSFLRKNEKGRIAVKLSKEISVDSSLTCCVLRTFKDTVGVGEIILP